MRRIVIILFLMMLIGTASAVSTLYLMPMNASEPMPNAKQSADTIHRDVAGAYASYTNPAILSETMGSTPLTRESTAAEAGAVHYTHYGTWVTNPLAAQWVNGTVTVNLTMRESSSSANVMPRLKIYRWYANDTKGSELRTIGNSATEVGTSYPATPIRYFNAVALTSTLFEEGDRIAVELESYDNNAVTTSWLHGIRYGGTAGNSSHIVFSQTLAYAPTKETIVYSGQRPINDKLSIISDSAARSTTLAVEMHKVVGAITLPYKFTDGTTEITIKKIELNVPDAKVGYYINAIRDGQEVHTHSPVWVVNSPYEVTRSESTNTLLNEKTITVKEDPQSAAQQVLAGYVSRQPLGKAEGDDVLIVYTTGEEDGALRSSNTGGVSFDTLRSHAGTTAYKTDASYYPGLQSHASSANAYINMYRGYFELNTSSLPDDCTVNSAIFGLTGHATVQTGLGSTPLGITGFAPATNGTAVSGDYDSFGDIRYATDIPIASWSTAGYNNYTFWDNATQYISKTAYTNLMFRTKWDIDNDTTGLTWAGSNVFTRAPYQNQEHGDTGRPFIEITYTPAAGGSAPVSSFTVNRPIARIPQVLTFTNTSTNTPTGWNWSWGDGTWTNGTTNNPTHQYKKRGIFPVFLLSSNAIGSNTSATQNIRVVGYENYW